MVMGKKNELNHIKKIKIYVKTKPNKQNLLKICKVCFHCWVMACYCNHQELPCDLLSPSVRQAPFSHAFSMAIPNLHSVNQILLFHPFLTFHSTSFLPKMPSFFSLFAYRASTFLKYPAGWSFLWGALTSPGRIILTYPSVLNKQCIYLYWHT